MHSCSPWMECHSIVGYAKHFLDLPNNFQINTYLNVGGMLVEIRLDRTLNRSLVNKIL